MKSIILLSLLTMSFKAHANDGAVSFDNVQLQGNGCPSSTASTVLSPDKSAVSILFDELSVEVPFTGYDNDLDYNREPALRARKVCNMVFEVKVPAGKRVKSLKFKSDFRGFSFGESGTTTKFNSRLISLSDGSNKKKLSKTIVSKDFGSYEHDEDIDVAKAVKFATPTACQSYGSKTIRFVVKNYLEAKTKEDHFGNIPEAQIMIDSSDATGNFKVALETESCPGYRPSRPNHGDRYDRNNRNNRNSSNDRSMARKCRAAGGTWHANVNRCISVARPYRRR